MKKIITALTFFALLLPVNAPQAGDVQSIISGLRARLEAMNTCSGNITWIKTGEPVTGNFYYMAPGNLHIKFTSPHNKIMATNGKKLWIHDPSNKVCVEQDLDEEFSGGLLLLLKSYEAVPVSESPAGPTLKFSNPDRYYSEITVSMDPLYNPRRIVFSRADSEPVTFILSSISTQPNVLKSIFDFKIPADTQVIKNPLDIR